MDFAGALVANAHLLCSSIRKEIGALKKLKSVDYVSNLRLLDSIEYILQCMKTSFSFSQSTKTHGANLLEIEFSYLAMQLEDAKKTILRVKNRQDNCMMLCYATKNERELAAAFASLHDVHMTLLEIHTSWFGLALEFKCIPFQKCWLQLGLNTRSDTSIIADEWRAAMLTAIGMEGNYWQIIIDLIENNVDAFIAKLKHSDGLIYFRDLKRIDERLHGYCKTVLDILALYHLDDAELYKDVCVTQSFALSFDVNEEFHVPPYTLIGKFHVPKMDNFHVIKATLSKDFGFGFDLYAMTACEHIEKLSPRPKATIPYVADGCDICFLAKGLPEPTHTLSATLELTYMRDSSNRQKNPIIDNICGIAKNMEEKE